MPWYRVEEISEYRLNTKKLDAWLKAKWGNYDYQIQVQNYRRALFSTKDLLTLIAKVQQRPVLFLVSRAQDTGTSSGSTRDLKRRSCCE